MARYTKGALGAFSGKLLRFIPYGGVRGQVAK